MGTEKKAGERAGRVLVWCALGFCLAAAAYLAYTTLPCADDFWYRNFFNYGFKKYLSTMKLHYETFNGRVLVHVAAQAILKAGNAAYVLTVLAFILAAPSMALLSRGGDKRGLPMAASLFACGFLLIPKDFMVMAVLWISSFCNHVLPVALICGHVWLFTSALRRERNGALVWLGCLTLAFACGATTEQTGLAAVLLTGYFFVKSLFLRRGRWMTFLSTLLSAAGIASVFLSPATMTRMRLGTKLGGPVAIIRGMYANLGPAAAELTNSPLLPVLFAALYMLAAAKLSERLRGRWPLYVGGVLSLLALSTPFLSGGALTALFTLLCFAAAASGVALMAAGEETPGLLALFGMGMLAIILTTDMAQNRTLLPTCLYVLAAVSSMAPERLRRLSPLCSGLVAAALALTALAMLVPTLRGVTYNYGVELENRENERRAHETGRLNYRIDYDFDYTYIKMSASFEPAYLEGIGLDADTEIHYYGVEWPNLFVDGELLFPVYPGPDGLPMFHIRLIEEFGGRVDPINGDYGHLELTMPGIRCVMTTESENRSTFTWTGADGTEHTASYARVFAESRTWFPMELFTEVFGLSFSFDEANNAWTAAGPAE